MIQDSRFTKKILFLGILLISFVFILSAQAAPPASPYLPGETLAPNCVPSDPNCTVLPALTGTSTIGNIGFYTGTTTISGDNNLFWDNTNKRLGVGTASPAFTLDVTGTIRSTGNLTAPNVIYSLTAGNGISISSGQNPTISNIGVLSLNNATGTLTIQGTTNQVNVSTNNGTITLSTPQDIHTGASPTFSNLTIPGTATTTNLTALGLTSLATTTISTQLTVPIITSSGTLTISPSSNATTTITGPVILASQTGNVGIGTTGPSQKLTVAGNIGIQAGANAFIGTLDNNALSLRTNNTDRIYITNAGNVGIGTTPEAKLEINTNGVDPGIFLYRDDGTGQANLNVTTYGVNGGGIIHVNYARGTKANPQAVQAGDITGGIGSRPYDGTGFLSSSPTSIHWVASENFDATHHGSYLRILTTPKGSTTRQERVVVSDNGTLWAHDTATFDPTVDLQTKPVADIVILGSGATGTGVSIGAFGYNGITAGFRGGSCKGSPASPTASDAGQVLTYIGGHGFDGTNWSLGSKAMISFKASELWSPTAQGTYMTFETTSNGSTVRTERMRIDNAGNVGIGTTSPAYKLDIAGALRLQPSSTSTKANGVIYYDSTTNKFKCYENGAWVDCIGGGHWAATDTNIYNTNTGNVGIGTTTPATTFQVVGTSTLRTILPEADNLYSLGSAGLRWANLYAATTTVGDLVFKNEFRFVETDASSSPQALILENQRGEEIMKIDESGNLEIKGVVSRLMDWVLEGLKKVGLWIENGIAKVKELIAEKITTKQICLEGDDGETICINKNQLKELLQKSGSQININQTSSQSSNEGGQSGNTTTTTNNEINTGQTGTNSSDPTESSSNNNANTGQAGTNSSGSESTDTGSAENSNTAPTEGLSPATDSLPAENSGKNP